MKTTAGLAAAFAMSATLAAEPRLIVSTAGHFWQTAPAPRWSGAATAPAGTIVLDLDRTQTAQTIAGFGGCFNEHGWEVLGLLSPAQRDTVLRDLFDPAGACRFVFGRLPMGANDYALDWYSFDETRDDYALAHFNIERDRQHLIPYLKAALRFNPALQLWASPWCPPSWMKTNGHYAGSPAPVNDLKPEQAGREMQTQFRMEPAVLTAYANYFARFLAAYRAEGISVQAVHVQNEPNSAQNFPSCVWTPADLATFIGSYLGPTLRAASPATEIWLGTIERPQIERIDAIVGKAEVRPFITGVGFQWAGRGAIADVERKYPDLRLMQTETECGNGANDWAAAEHTFGLMQHYFNHGAGAYMYWNLVLDETGTSRWGWRQNAMVTVNRGTHVVTYNPEFILLQHFSHFIQPGAHRLALGDSVLPALAFANPDGGAVVIFANLGDAAATVQVNRAGRSLTATAPAHSFSTLCF